MTPRLPTNQSPTVLLTSAIPDADRRLRGSDLGASITPLYPTSLVTASMASHSRINSADERRRGTLHLPLSIHVAPSNMPLTQSPSDDARQRAPWTP